MLVSKAIKKSLNRRNTIDTIKAVVFFASAIILVVSILAIIVLAFTTLVWDLSETTEPIIYGFCISFGVSLWFVCMPLMGMSIDDLGIQDMFWCKPTSQHFEYLMDGNTEYAKLYDIAAKHGVYFCLRTRAVVINIAGLDLPKNRGFNSLRFCEMWMEYKDKQLNP